jgi:hypothetical protein
VNRFLIAAPSLLLTLLTPQAPLAPGLPQRLEEYLATAVRPSRAERALLLQGSPITKFLESDPSQEVATFGAVWIDAPMQRYADAVMNIETIERGGAFTKTRRIGRPPGPADFADLQLPPDDIADLKGCRRGDCEVKVTAALLDALRASVEWSSPAASERVQSVFRAFALDYVRAYYDRGNAALATYHDKAQPTSVAADFAGLAGRGYPFSRGLNGVRRYLLDYPTPETPGAREIVYWQETRFGLKPTIRISHVVVHESAEETVVASKMLYASHYFRAALELRVLVPDPGRGRGFWFVTVSRSRVDGLSGFLGRLLRGKVRSEIQEGTLSGLRATKRRLELAH